MASRLYYLIALLLFGNYILLSMGQFVKYPPSVHTCVHASTVVGKRGDGSTEESCMGCDPTYPTCSEGCQALIDRMYRRCDGICLPNGYHFDPQWDLEGCWAENLPAIKIKVERCGCNAAFATSPLSISLVILAILFSLFMLL